MANVYTPPQALDGNGNPIVGSNIFRFYEAGETTTLEVFQDKELTNSEGFAIDTDANGFGSNVYFAIGKKLKVRIHEADGTLLREIDNALFSPVDESAASGVGIQPTTALPYTTVQDAMEGLAEKVSEIQLEEPLYRTTGAGNAFTLALDEPRTTRLKGLGIPVEFHAPATGPASLDYGAGALPIMYRNPQGNLEQVASGRVIQGGTSGWVFDDGVNLTFMRGYHRIWQAEGDQHSVLQTNGAGELGFPVFSKGLRVSQETITIPFSGAAVSIDFNLAAPGERVVPIDTYFYTADRQGRSITITTGLGDPSRGLKVAGSPFILENSSVVDDQRINVVGAFDDAQIIEIEAAPGAEVVLTLFRHEFVD